MTDIINEEENTNNLPEEEQESVVVDNGQTYVSEETAIVATEAAAQAKQWAQESERQANIATTNADAAVDAKDDAIAAKEYAEAAITDTNLITVATDLSATPSNIKTVATNISNVNTVAGVSSAVTTVAEISSNVTAVAGNSANVTTVATSISNVNKVGNDISNVNSVADDLTNIDNVAGDLTNIDTVAGVSSEVSMVAGISSNVTTVAGISSNVSAVAGNASNINAVAGNASNINAVNANKTNIDNVAGNKTNINTVAGISSDVSDVADMASDIAVVVSLKDDIPVVVQAAADIDKVEDIAEDITTVSGISNNVTTVAGISSDITAVAGNNANITAVAGNATNINAVNANKTNIDAVAGNATNINAVNANKTNIDAVAGDLTNINTVAADLTNIDNASTYANNANIWAEGTDAQVQALGGIHSSKGWANQSAQGQVQSDWTEADTSSKAYILNKPTAGDNISLANNQIAAVSDASPTQNSTNLVQSGGVFTALNAKQDVATAVNYNNITNCITEIPQDIKLELNNGVLTLKAGSKVYIPNGFTGTTPRYDVVTIASDMAMNGGSANGTEFVYVVANGASVYHYLDNSSGTDWTATSQYQCRYNTTDNMIKNTNNTGSTWLSQLSFPIARVKLSSGTVTSIDQVFNGFGYIGSTVFALPGVKGLIPNGRNADGTLKNIEFTIPSVKIKTYTDSRTSTLVYRTSDGISTYNDTIYDKESNLVTNSSGGNQSACHIGKVVYSSGTITSFEIKTAFHAVDYNDFKQADDNNVKLTGNQTIAGVKSFSDNIESLSLIKGTTETGSSATNHAINLGHQNKNYIDFYEYGGIFNFYKSRGGTNTLLGKVAELTTSTNDKTLATTEWVVNVLKEVYPVGAVYIGTTSTCPLAALFGTWTLKSSGIVTSVDSNVPVKGNGMTMGITTGTDNCGLRWGNLGTNHGVVLANPTVYGTDIGTSGSGAPDKTAISAGLTTDSTKSGIVGTISSTTYTVNIWERTA